MKKVTFTMYDRKIIEHKFNYKFKHFSVNIASNKDKLQVIKSLVKQ